MLTVKNVSKKLGNKTILHNLNFCLKKGEIIALLGPNGAGKTTLMRLLSGFYEQEEGKITYNSKDYLTSRNKILQEIAYVPEIGGLYPLMSVFEYLEFMGKVKHQKPAKILRNISILAKALDISAVMSKKCRTLSKGYKRRVAIAGALISSPKFLILDEPTEGLDPLQKQHLRDLLKKYSPSTIILISTHVMEEVELLADRILLIKEGHLICDTTPKELRKLARKDNIEDSFCSIVDKL